MAHATETVALYQKYGPALVRKAERILLSTDDACDVVQGLFVELMQRPRHNAELPYLYRAVTNRCLNLLRDRKNRERLLEQQQTALRGPARSRVDDQVIELDLLARLTDVVDGKTMEVLVCCFVDDMSQDEAAEFLGVSRRTVGKRLKTARLALAKLVGTTGEVARG